MNDPGVPNTRFCVVKLNFLWLVDIAIMVVEVLCLGLHILVHAALFYARHRKDFRDGFFTIYRSTALATTLSCMNGFFLRYVNSLCDEQAEPLSRFGYLFSVVMMYASLGGNLLVAIQQFVVVIDPFFYVKRSKRFLRLVKMLALMAQWCGPLLVLGPYFKHSLRFHKLADGRDELLGFEASIGEELHSTAAITCVTFTVLSAALITAAAACYSYQKSSNNSPQLQYDPLVKKMLYVAFWTFLLNQPLTVVEVLLAWYPQTITQRMAILEFFFWANDLAQFSDVFVLLTYSGPVRRLVFSGIWSDEADRLARSRQAAFASASSLRRKSEELKQRQNRPRAFSTPTDTAPILYSGTRNNLSLDAGMDYGVHLVNSNPLPMAIPILLTPGSPPSPLDTVSEDMEVGTTIHKSRSMAFCPNS